MKLNNKQLSFVENYLINGNASESYRLAYPNSTDNTARVNGYRLLTNTYIQSIIREKRDEVARRNNLTKDDVINVLASIMYDSQAKNTDRIKAASELNKMNGFNEIKTTNINISSSQNLKDLLGFDD